MLRQRLRDVPGIPPVKLPSSGVNFVYEGLSRPISDPRTFTGSFTPNKWYRYALTARFRFGLLGRHGLVYAVGIFLDKIVAFAMLPIYTRFMTPEDYGILHLVSMTLEIVSIIAGSRLATGIFRFYHKAEGEDARSRVLGTALVLMTGLYFLAGGAVWIFAEPISNLVFETPDRAGFIIVGGLGFAFSSLLVVPISHLQLIQRSTTFVWINAAKLGIQVGLNIALVVFLSMGAMGVLVSNLVANMVIGTMVVWMMLRLVGLRFSRSAVRDLLRFGIPMIGTQIAGFILTAGDKFFIQHEDGTEAVGIYGLAYQFGFLLTAVGYLPFQTAWDPVRFEVSNREDRDEVYSRVFVYFNLLLMTVALGIAVYVKDVLVIMADPAFHSAATLVPIILIAYALYSWTKFLDLGILVSEKTEYVTLANSVGAVVALVGYALLIPRYLGFGAAWATVVAFLVRLVLIHVISQRLWPVVYSWPPVWKIIGYASIAYVLSLAITTESVLLSLVSRTALIGVYALVVWFGGVLSDDDRTMLKRLVRSPKAAMASLAE